MRWTVFFACLLSASSCEREIELVESSAESVVLHGESRRSIAARIPSELSFPVELPRNAELSFSAALLTERRVPRARVDFRVELSADGRDVEVYRREVRAGEENQWLDARVNLWRMERKVRDLVVFDRALLRVFCSCPGSPACGRPGATPEFEPAERSRSVRTSVLRSSWSSSIPFGRTIWAPTVSTGAISPNLDRLAAESLLFESCFANAPWTKPSIATLFTSLPPGGARRDGLWGSRGGPERVTLDASAARRGRDDCRAIPGRRLPDGGVRREPVHLAPLRVLSGIRLFERKDENRVASRLGPTMAHGERIRLAMRPSFSICTSWTSMGLTTAPREDFETVLRQMDASETRTLTEEEYAADSRVPAANRVGLRGRALSPDVLAGQVRRRSPRFRPRHRSVSRRAPRERRPRPRVRRAHVGSRRGADGARRLEPWEQSVRATAPRAVDDKEAARGGRGPPNRPLS